MEVKFFTAIDQVQLFGKCDNGANARNDHQCNCQNEMRQIEVEISKSYHFFSFDYVDYLNNSILVFRIFQFQDTKSIYSDSQSKVLSLFKMGGSMSRPFYYLSYYRSIITCKRRLMYRHQQELSGSQPERLHPWCWPGTGPRQYRSWLSRHGAATTPCVKLPTTVLLVQSLAASCEYSLNMD